LIKRESSTVSLWVCCGIAIGLFASINNVQANPEDNNDMISFQVSIDKTEYHVGENAIIRLIVINHGAKPLYVSHGGLGSTCSKGSGFADVRFLDRQGRNVAMPGCDVAEYRIPGGAIKDLFNNSRSWILLLPGEVYGREENIVLPSRKGPYKIMAELWPPRFSTEDRKDIASEQIRVLSSRHSAPPLMIEIR
jgi:hypothetical protein